MRSFRSAPDPLDPGPQGFAHRGLHGPGVRENSLSAIDSAVRQGVGIECDVQLSADSIPVVLHDFELARLGEPELRDPREVASMTADGLGAYRLPDGLPVASRLSQALDHVAGRVPLLIEAKAAIGQLSRPRLIAEMIGHVIAGYDGPVGVMSFHPSVPRWFARHSPSVRRGLVIGANCSSVERWRRLLVAQPHFLAVDVAVINRRWVQKARKTIPVYSWTVRTAEDRARVERCADAAIWEGDGRP